MSRSDGTPEERIARSIADVVGDGCVVFARRSGVLRPVAVAHRDRERRDLFAHALASEPGTADPSWAAHALRKNLAFRLRHAHAAAAVSADRDVALDVAAAIVAPLRIPRASGRVVVAFRDSLDFGYSPQELGRVEQLAAGASPQELLRPHPAGAPAAAPSDRALEHAPAAVWATDAQGLTTYVNHAACQLAGAPESVLLGRPLSAFVDVHAALHHPVVSTPERRDQILTRADGGEFWVSLASAPLADSRGAPLGHVHTLVEVGERRGLEVAARLRASAYEAVADFAEVALAGEDFSVLAQEAVAIAADALGADYAALAHVGPLRATCTVRAVRGWPRQLVGLERELPERSPANLCLDEDQPVVVRDFAELEHLERGEEATRIAARSCVCASVGDRLGILTAHSRMPGAFSEQDLSFLGLLTAVLAVRWEPFPAAASAPLAALPVQ